MKLVSLQMASNLLQLMALLLQSLSLKPYSHTTKKLKQIEASGPFLRKLLHEFTTGGCTKRTEETMKSKTVFFCGENSWRIIF